MAASLLLLLSSACAPRPAKREVVPPHASDGSAGEGGDGGAGDGGDGGSAGAGGSSGRGGEGGDPGGDAMAGGGGAGGAGGSAPSDAAVDLPVKVDLASADLASRDSAVDQARDLAGPDTRDAAPAADVAATGTLGVGLVHHWKFDEGMDLSTADSSGRGNTGTLMGAPNWMPGGAPAIAGNKFSLMLDGTDDFVSLAMSLSPVLGGTASLSCWIKTMQTGDDNSFDAPGITGVEMSGGINDIFWGFIDRSGNIGFRPGSGTPVKSAAPVNDNMWHHAVMTRDKLTGTIQMFVDGKLARAVTTLTGDKTQTFAALGRITNSQRPYYRGQLDDVRIWDRVLTPVEVASLFAGN